MAIWMMTVMECEESLHEVVPDSVFWYWTIVFLGLFDNCGEVTSTTVFHENVEYSCIAVYVTIVIAYDMFMVKVFEDITVRMFM